MGRRRWAGEKGWKGGGKQTPTWSPSTELELGSLRAGTEVGSGHSPRTAQASSAWTASLILGHSGAAGAPSAGPAPLYTRRAAGTAQSLTSGVCAFLGPAAPTLAAACQSPWGATWLRNADWRVLEDPLPDWGASPRRRRGVRGWDAGRVPEMSGTGTGRAGPSRRGRTPPRDSRHPLPTLGILEGPWTPAGVTPKRPECEFTSPSRPPP